MLMSNTHSLRISPAPHKLYIHKLNEWFIVCFLSSWEPAHPLRMSAVVDFVFAREMWIDEASPTKHQMLTLDL